MARTEADKEDLMVEATALMTRAEFGRGGDAGQQTAWRAAR